MEEKNAKKKAKTGETMLDIHMRIAQHSEYGITSTKRRTIFRDYQKIIDRMNIDMADEAYRHIFIDFPEIQKNVILLKSMMFGVSSHINRNILYDGQPYFIHLSMVYKYALKYIHLLQQAECDADSVLQATWLHDVIEDCSVTYNDVLKHFNKEVTEITFLLSNDRGRTRDERNSDNYYLGIAKNHGALFVKLCDRLANASYSKLTDGHMLKKYRKENRHFKESLQVDQSLFLEMFDEIDQLLAE